MASNSFGNIFRFTTFGESHGMAIGVIVDGVPAGLELNEKIVQIDLDKRRPGQSSVTTPRKETDTVQIMSGVFEGKTTGHSIGMIIHNSDAVSTQYDNIKNLYRPGHADFTYHKKYGIRDYRGSGRASGRETACRVAAGAVAKQIIKKYNIDINAASVQIGDVKAAKWDSDYIYKNSVRTADKDKALQMENIILTLSQEGDSIGGIIECRISNAPIGLGEPIYKKLDAEIAHAIMGIAAIKGIEFGAGFDAAQMKGSENNDPITPEGFLTNHAGGILGGISNGETISFRVAVKPTSSISKPQKSIDIEGKPVDFTIDGRHDPCLLPRMVPVVEAMTACVFADLMLMAKAIKL